MANFDDLFTTPAAPELSSAPPQLTKEEYAAKKKAERDDLYALADEMAHEIMQDGDAFRGFLDVQARFDRYLDNPIPIHQVHSHRRCDEQKLP